MRLVSRVLHDRPDSMAPEMWSRSVALLARQDLEIALRKFWARFVPGMGTASTRAQLLALPEYFKPDPRMAVRLHWLWEELSTACHLQPYHFGPSRSEVGHWVAAVETFAREVERITSTGGTRQ